MVSQNNNSSKNSEKKKVSKPFSNSDIAFSMVAIISLGAFIGNRLDTHFNTSKPYYTIVACFIAIGGAMYNIIKGR